MSHRHRVELYRSTGGGACGKGFEVTKRSHILVLVTMEHCWRRFRRLRKHTGSRNKSGSTEGVRQVGKEDGGELVTADTRPTTPGRSKSRVRGF